MYTSVFLHFLRIIRKGKNWSFLGCASSYRFSRSVLSKTCSIAVYLSLIRHALRILKSHDLLHSASGIHIVDQVVIGTSRSFRPSLGMCINTFLYLETN